ncbi:hypothetical protein, conserved, partial [Eimeria tenella]
ADQYVEAALVGGLSSSLAGAAAAPLDAARAVVAQQAGDPRFSGVLGVGNALREAAAKGGLGGLFASAPLRVLLGGCCGAAAAAFNLKCMHALARLRAAADAAAADAAAAAAAARNAAAAA